jgi:hypothetical protein
MRARGKATIVSLIILNQFGANYSVLHDADHFRTILLMI